MSEEIVEVKEKKGVSRQKVIVRTSIIGIAVGVGLIWVSVLVTVIAIMVLASSFLFHDGNSRQLAMEQEAKEEKEKAEKEKAAKAE